MYFGSVLISPRQHNCCYYCCYCCYYYYCYHYYYYLLWLLVLSSFPTNTHFKFMFYNKNYWLITHQKKNRCPNLFHSMLFKTEWENTCQKVLTIREVSEISSLVGTWLIQILKECTGLILCEVACWCIGNSDTCHSLWATYRNFY